MITMMSRFEIITTSISPSTTSITIVSGAALMVSAPTGVMFRRIDGERILVAERRFDQVEELDQEIPDVDALGDDESQVERQLQPPAHEQDSGYRTQVRCGHGGRVTSRESPGVTETRPRGTRSAVRQGMERASKFSIAGSADGIPGGCGVRFAPRRR